MGVHSVNGLFFFFNDTATTEIYTLSLHDALPISGRDWSHRSGNPPELFCRRLSRCTVLRLALRPDRKSTRLNSSHSQISYAVFCLKKKNPPIPGIFVGITVDFSSHFTRFLTPDRR